VKYEGPSYSERDTARTEEYSLGSVKKRGNAKEEELHISLGGHCGKLEVGGAGNVALV